MNKIDHIVELLKQRLMKGGLSAHEEFQLQRYLQEYPYISDLLEEIKDDKLRDIVLFYLEKDTDNTDRVWEKIIGHVHQEHSVGRIGKPKHYWKYVAAAVVAVASCISLYTFVWKNKTEHVRNQVSYSEQLLPGTNKATLTLPEGKSFVLNDKKNGIVMKDGITYVDGTLLLEGNKLINPTDLLTLSTPGGGQYQLELPDGSKVWLNAESSITYPVKFDDKQRLVKLNGEAYFEIAKKSNQRFIVETFHERVEVLGTHFNVNAYSTDGKSAVTLTEGSVHVSFPSNQDFTHRLKPGQQSTFSKGRIGVQDVDVNEYIAWKNGEFMFNNETLEEAVKLLSRWYDFEATIDPRLKDLTVWGSISRYDTFDKVLNIIKMADESIHITIQGRRVFIMR